MSASWQDAATDQRRYHIQRKLARDGRLDRDVVLKVPRQGLLEEPEFAARRRREIQSLVSLTHPHMVRVLDQGKQEGRPFAVLAHSSGGGPAGHLRTADGEPRSLPRKNLREWFPQIAPALDFVHAEGYVHRDVKPGNILFDVHGQPYLTDFVVQRCPQGTSAAFQLPDQGPRLTASGTMQSMRAECLLVENLADQQ